MVGMHEVRPAPQDHNPRLRMEPIKEGHSRTGAFSLMSTVSVLGLEKPWWEGSLACRLVFYVQGADP